jgi:hypothetical protein
VSADIEDLWTKKYRTVNIVKASSSLTS